MPIRRYKPTSPGRRFMSVSTFEEITKTEPEKSLLAPVEVRGRCDERRRRLLRLLDEADDAVVLVELDDAVLVHELEVAHVVWARSLVVSETALPLVQGRAQ